MREVNKPGSYPTVGDLAAFDRWPGGTAGGATTRVLDSVIVMPDQDDAPDREENKLALALPFFTIGIALAVSTEWVVGLPFLILALVFYTEAVGGHSE